LGNSRLYCAPSRGNNTGDRDGSFLGHYEKATRRREAEAMAGVFGV
jgi:hypothetical protein